VRAPARTHTRTRPVQHAIADAKSRKGTDKKRKGKKKQRFVRRGLYFVCGEGAEVGEVET